MIRKYTLSAIALAFAVIVGSAVARADATVNPQRADGRIKATPAVLTSDESGGSPITAVQYRRVYRGGLYGGYGGYGYRGYAYPRYSYGYGYYPRSYSYYPRSYGYYPSYGYVPSYGRYAYSSPYYGGYYPRYYSGYRGGFSYSGPRFYGSFYW